MFAGNFHTTLFDLIEMMRQVKNHCIRAVPAQLHTHTDYELSLELHIYM